MTTNLAIDLLQDFAIVCLSVALIWHFRSHDR